MTRERMVLAYSGDLFTSAVLAWLVEHETGEVATVTLDLGQGRDLNDVRDRALGIGAVRAHVLDVREAFARQAVMPAWRQPLSDPRAAALARPFIARHTLEVARIEGTTTIAHASAFPADDPAGLEAALRALDASLEILAPVRDQGLSRDQVLDYGRSRGIPVPVASERARLDVRNLWGRSVTTDALDRPWAEPAAGLYTLTRSVEGWAKDPATLEITFDHFTPVALNGVTLPLVELIVSLETIAGAHGVGRLDFPAVPGVRPRTLEEAPASVVLHQALASLEGASGEVRLTCFAGESRVDGKALA